MTLNIDTKNDMDEYYSNLIIKGLYKKKIQNLKNKKYSYQDIENFIKTINCKDLDITKDIIEDLTFKLFDTTQLFNLIKEECINIGNLDNFKIPDKFKILKDVVNKDKLTLLSNILKKNKNNIKNLETILNKGETLCKQDGGLFTDGILTNPDDSGFTKFLDILQTIADIVGFFPVIGDFVDIGNGVISLLRGDFLGAILSFIAVIPIVGSIIGVPIKVFRKFRKARRAYKIFKKVRKSRKFANIAKKGRLISKRGQQIRGYIDDAQDLKGEPEEYYDEDMDYYN